MITTTPYFFPEEGPRIRRMSLIVLLSPTGSRYICLRTVIFVEYIFSKKYGTKLS